MDAPPVSSRILNVPNAITTLRLILSCVVGILIECGYFLPAGIIFLIAALSDMLDGWWARRFQQITKLGRILDPFVDKIIITAALVALVGVPGSFVRAWMVTLIIGREFLVTSLRAMIEGQGGDFSARWLGKWKMVLQSAAIIACLLKLHLASEATALLWTVQILLWSAVLLTLASGVDYVVQAIRIAQQVDRVTPSASWQFKLSRRACIMNHCLAALISPEQLEQNPLVALVLSAFTLLFLMFIAGVLITWTALAIRLWRGQPLLVVEPWKPRVWGLFDLLVVAVLVLAFQVQGLRWGSRLLAINLQQVEGSDHAPLSLVTIMEAGNALAMLVSILWLGWRHRASLAQVGMSLQGLAKHLALGGVAALATLPLVYALMAAVSIGFDTAYKHPLVEQLLKDGTLTAFMLASVSAVIIAPITEEFLFRVMIQGWLQSLPYSSLKAIVFGESEQKRESSRQFANSPLPVDAPPEAGDQENVADAPTNPYQPQSSDRTTTGSLITDQPPTPPLWPSFVTAVLFGLAHFSYGLSYIPLIVLGLVMGLLYRATHSIWPSLVVHIVLNGSSMLALGVNILVKQTEG